MKKTRPLLLGLILAPAMLFAQTNTTPAAGSPNASTDTTGQKTVEDVYLQSSVEVQVVKSLVAESGRADKLTALGYLKKMVDDGKVSDKNKDVVSILEDLSGEGVSKEVRANGRIINDYPDVRQQSAALLGQIGGDQAREILINIALKDPEPMVISEAVYSLGLIGGGDDPSRVENLIANLIRVQDSVRADSNFAIAAVYALEKLGDKHQGKVSPEVFSALIRIVNGNYIRPVREKAKEVLDKYTKF